MNIIEERIETDGFDTRKQWIGYALALSLALHIWAALVVVFACSSSRNVKIPGAFDIQEVAFTPAISATAKAVTTPPTSPSMSEPNAAKVDGQSEQAVTPEQQPSQTHDEPARVFQSTPLGLGMAHGYFTGLGDGMSLRHDIRDYYFEMVGKINGEWWDRSGALTESLRQDGVVELTIQRDGTIVKVQIIQGTGSRQADRILMEAIQNTRLAPLPPTYEMDIFAVPLRIKAPSSLFRLG